MRALFLFLISFSVIVTNAQKQGEALIDSLISEIPKEKDDTLRAKIIYQVVLYYAQSNPLKSIEYAERGLNLSRKAKWKKGEGSFLISIGNAYSYLGQYNKALLIMDTALVISREINNRKAISVALNTTAGIYLQQGNHTKATEYFFQALKVAEEIKDTLSIGDANFNIAGVYASQNDHEKALNYHIRALNCYRSIQNTERIEAALTSAGLDYSNQKEYDKAQEYLSKALAVNKQTGNNRQLAYIFGNFGSLYSSKKDVEKALIYYLKANDLWKEIAPASQNAISIVGNIGGAYLDLAQSDSAISAIHKQDPQFQRPVLLANAEIYLKKAIQGYKENGDIVYESIYGQMLADVYAMKAEYKNAFENYKLYHTRDDSIHSQETKNTIAGIEAQREITIRDKEIQISKLALSNQRKTQLALIGGLILLSIIGALLFWQSRTRKKTNTTLMVLNSELDEANKVKAKFFSILSHDLRRPVAKLVSFLHLQQDAPDLMSKEAAEQHSRKITASAENLLENMEELLMWSKGQMENFKPDKKSVYVSKLFGDIEDNFSGFDGVKFIFTDQQQLKINTDEDYLKTIMRNLTANSVKALQEIENARIEWKAWEENGKQFLSITDNGKGISEQQLNALNHADASLGIKSGLGLHLVKDMAKAIHSTISFQSQPGKGTTFILSV